MAFWWGEIFPNGLMGCIPDGGESITLCDRRQVVSQVTQEEQNKGIMQRNMPGTSFDRSGVGLQLGQLSSGTLVVRQTVRGSPAQTCGHIEAGDVLLKLDKRKIHCAPVVEVAQAMLGRSGTTVLLTLLRSFRLKQEKKVEHIIYSIRLTREASNGMHPVPLPHELRDDDMTPRQKSREEELIAEAASDLPVLPPPPPGSWVPEQKLHPVFSMPSILIPFKFQGMAYTQLAPTEQIKLMERMKGYKQSLKELAKQFPAYGVPNTVITENLNGASRATSGGMGGGSVFEGLSQTEYLSTTVMVGCKSVPDVGETNTVLLREMVLRASHFDLEFTVENSGEGWREGL